MQSVPTRKWWSALPLCAAASLLLAALAAGPAGAAPIDLNGIRFDPLVEEPSIPAELLAPPARGPSLHLLQFSGPIEETWKEQVRRLGGEFFGYVPENSFIVRIDREAGRTISALPFVSWIGPYHVAYRIDPAIGTTEFQNPDRAADPRFTLRVRVADEPAAAARAAGRIGEVVEILDDPFAPGFVARVDPERVGDIAALPSVLYVEELPECFLLNNTTKWVVQSNQNGQTPIWAQGIRGEGQLLCMMDSGLDYNSCWFREQGNAPPGPNHRKVVDYRVWGGGNAYDGCGSGHGTHVAGTAVGDQSYINPGNFNHNGMAYLAQILVQDVGGDSWLECFFGLISPPSSLTSAFGDAYAKGARAHTNSWGSTSNAYDGYAVNIDSFMWNNPDFLVLFANGNSGPGSGTVGSPATAKNCVSVGATRQAPNQESITSYSSRGPASDGRRKPTVAAPGGDSPVYIDSADNHTGNPPSPTCNVQGGFGGTSMATPAVAGTALLVRDYFAQGFYPNGEAGGEPISPSAALVKAVLVNAGAEMGAADQPNDNEGWGRILLEDALHFQGQSRELRIEEERTGLATGEQIAYVYAVDSASEPLEITLVWTDYPGAQGANPALVNNLDLEVRDPTGALYRGNVYSGGQSSTGGSADNRNVEECVRRNIPAVGDWTITVRGTNVPQGGRQPFALVATGSFGNWPEPPAGAPDATPLVRLRLDPARPNPSGEATRLGFALPRETDARLAIHDVSGRRVALLADGRLGPGAHEIEWDGTGIDGGRVGAGIYFYRLETPEATITRKITRLQ